MNRQDKCNVSFTKCVCVSRIHFLNCALVKAMLCLYGAGLSCESQIMFFFKSCVRAITALDDDEVLSQATPPSPT